MRLAESSNGQSSSDSNESQSSVKRPKLDDELNDKDDGNVRRRFTKQIHILAEVLDVLKIGSREPKMSKSVI